MNKYNSFSGLIIFKTQLCVFYETCPKKFCDEKNLSIEKICLKEKGRRYREFPLRIQEVQDYLKEMKDLEKIMGL